MGIFSILILMTIFGMSFFYYYRSTKIILDLSDSVVREVTGKIIERTNHYVRTPALQTRAISHLVGGSNIIEMHETIWKYTWEQLLNFSQVQSIFVADEKGNYVQVRREPRYATRTINRLGKVPLERWYYRDEQYNLLDTREKVPTFDPRTRPWYKNTRAEPKIYWTDVYVFTTAQTPGISATYPVVNEKGEMIAVACVNSPLHSLSDFIAEQDVSKNGLIFIANANNDLLAYANKENTLRKDQKTGKWRLSKVSELQREWIRDAFSAYRRNQKKQGAKSAQHWFSRFFAGLYDGNLLTIEELFLYPERNFSVSETQGARYITYAVPFPAPFASKWEIFIVLPEKDLTAPLIQLGRTATVTAILFMCLSLIIIYFVINALSNPIIKLAGETEKISRFDLDEVETVSSSIKEVDIMNKALLSATNGLQSFKKYVPSSLVRQLVEHGQEVKLGGEELELTIFFSDIQGFTSITDRMAPNELMEHLSEYLKRLSNIIMKNGGTIDKYIGDAIMAFWGAPIKNENAPFLACKSALECRNMLVALNNQWVAEGKYPLVTRFGVHTGKTIVGNLGSDDRMNYTIIGNSVNLASRLEGINKLYGTGIIISEDTYRKVSGQFYCRLLDYVSVKGQSKGYRIYELVDDVDADIEPKVKNSHKRYEYGLQAYLQQDWNTAVSVFNELHDKDSDNKAVMALLKRCVYYMRNPDKIKDDWDGLHNIGRKK